MVPDAKKLCVQAVGVVEGGPYVGRSVYGLEGYKGLFRRVSREGRTGRKVGEENVLACTDTGFAELRQWSEAMAELGDAFQGFIGGQEDPPCTKAN